MLKFQWQVMQQQSSEGSSLSAFLSCGIGYDDQQMTSSLQLCLTGRMGNAGDSLQFLMTGRKADVLRGQGVVGVCDSIEGGNKNSFNQQQSFPTITHYLQILFSKSKAMLELEPVTKYRKEAYSKYLKDKDKNKLRKSQTVEFDGGMAIGQILEFISMPRHEIYQERQFQDSHLTRFLYEQLLLTKFMLTLLGLTSILISILETLISFTSQHHTVILILQSVISLTMVVLIIIQYVKDVELGAKQLIRRKKSSPYIDFFKSVSIEVILLLVHPNVMADGVILQLVEPVYNQTMPIQLNSLLQIVMMGRIYLLYDSIISSSIYFSTRASRVCRIYSTKNVMSFGTKSFFNAKPLQSIAILYTTLLITFSRMLSLAEQNNTNFRTFQDFVWCIIITMGTIGYGDYSPGTYIGRLIAFSAAISGIILASLLILTLSQYLTMSTNESKSHVTLKRLALRQLLEKYAEQAIAETSKLGGGGALQSVKRKSERVKLTLRRLKNTVDSNNLNEEISNLFQSLYGNLMDIYLQQKTYADALMTLHKQQSISIQEIGFTFAGQIQNIIKDK